MKHRDLLVFIDFEPTELSTRSTKSTSEKLESQVVEFER
ncbi:hypothetical protein VCEM1727_003170 [Vibrio cholerae O1 str. EM-1727]|nr:hypothetical protein ASZ81_03283 [Vibrio cholerae]EEY42136.1 hypothetical protein VIJ_001371 [Vibrio cholerae RC27]EEY49406.1 hypothetical protein VIG_000615 [Vibrio cholerae INDRE 91/1]EJH79545.1 hypothetical protein VCCP10303_3197 [Vibrio cholerae CP1030(3)]EJH80246.1 hypothetical protein VCCP1047_3371 [Vibrio cholerae CP1047(20)]EMQ20871.1 hypothetical protein VCEC0051_003202 [Vibrio cholerae O1 str. EC-0051]EMQ60355.1 hypothetical protein VCEM1727_003170 [Vibrio cholerae O1 str. EM-172